MAQGLSEADQLQLIDRLADGAWHSGETLAAAFGISRAALAKRIDRLQDWQLAVEARQGIGYRLAAPLERLDAQRLRAAVPQLRVDVQAVADSTSTRVLEAPAVHDPQVLLAEYQTAGRGRRGRQWVSPFGAQLALSLAWSFESIPPQLGALPLAVGVVCARSLRRMGVDGIGLKWPNDIVVAGKAPATADGGGVCKLGGILLEHRGEGGGGCRIVIGIGINFSVQPEQAAAVTQPWINLDGICDRRVSRNALAAELLAGLHEMLGRYPQTGFAALAGEWGDYDITFDRQVRVLIAEREIFGRARGVDADGALQLVDTCGERHLLHSGEVSLRVAS